MLIEMLVFILLAKLARDLYASASPSALHEASGKGTTRHQRSTRSGEAPKGKGGMHEGASVRSGLHGDKSGDRGTRKRGGIFQVP